MYFFQIMKLFLYMPFFEALTLVKNIQTSEINGSRIEIAVDVEDDIYRLHKSLIRSGRFLSVVTEQSFDSGEIALRWVKR